MRDPSGSFRSLGTAVTIDKIVKKIMHKEYMFDDDDFNIMMATSRMPSSA